MKYGTQDCRMAQMFILPKSCGRAQNSRASVRENKQMDEEMGSTVREYACTPPACLINSFL